MLHGFDWFGDLWGGDAGGCGQLLLSLPGLGRTQMCIRDRALQALYEQVGIPCLTVSGQWNGENHMWNLVWLDGEWRYCDATSDRGRSEFGFGCYRVTAENLWGHTWDQDWVARLTSGLEV